MDKVILDEMQLLQLKRFIRIKGIKEEDVILEILDHFACKTEELMNEDIYLPFEKATEAAYYSFGNNGFKNMSLQYEKRLKRLVWTEFKPALGKVMHSKLIVCSFIWCTTLFTLIYFIELHKIESWLHEFVTYSAGISMLIFYVIRFHSSMIAKDGLGDYNYDKNLKMWQKKVVKMPKVDGLFMLVIFALPILKFDPDYFILSFMTMAFLGLANSLARKETMKRINLKFNRTIIYG